MGKALDHKKRVLARQQAEARGETQTETMEGASAYDQHLMQLTAHLRQLKALKSTRAKVNLKGQIISDYDAYIDGVLDSGAGVQDDVFMTAFVWLVDLGQFKRAIALAIYALEHDLKMPERFNRDVASFLVDEISESMLATADIDIDILSKVETLTAEADIHDQVRAKLHKIFGKFHALSEDVDKAIASYSTALEFDDKCGVKTVLKGLEKRRDLAAEDAKKAKAAEAAAKKAPAKKATPKKAAAKKAPAKKAETKPAEAG